jgi:hypothetical protein
VFLQLAIWWLLVGVVVEVVVVHGLLVAVVAQVVFVLEVDYQ